MRVGLIGDRLTEKPAQLRPSVSAADVHRQQVVGSMTEVVDYVRIVFPVSRQECLGVEVLPSVNNLVHPVRPRIHVPFPAVRIMRGAEMIPHALQPFLFIADGEDKFGAGVGAVEFVVENSYG
jgi:hypothetical protein